ncbi:MAG TPA: flavodoxin, partial [Armatimonadetes bacterium]|nr:flavodoxin [Armatimonadota bacterium]
MKTAVIYHSFFHTTEQYAKWIAEEIGAETIPMRKAKNLSGFDRLIIMSGTYAGWMPL